MLEDSYLQKQLDDYGKDVFDLTEQGKILCKLTNHEFPFRKTDFQTFIESQKFLRSYGLYKFLEKYGEHFEDIGKNLYGCKLTKRAIAKDVKSLNAHVNGIKFKKALQKHQQELEQQKEAKSDSPADEEQVDEEMLDAEQEKVSNQSTKRKKTSEMKRRPSIKKSRKT